jgi:hypothetical protein
MDATDLVLVVDASGNDVEVLLPIISTVPGKFYLIKVKSITPGHNITIQPSGTNQINYNGASAPLFLDETTSGFCVGIVADNTDGNWQTVVVSNPGIIP